MPRTLLRTTALAAAVLAAPLAAADPTPPPGFTAAFNGKDFTGWYGWPIHAKGAAPADVARMSAEQLQAKKAEWTADAKKNWQIDNGELVNHGKGAYLTTEKEYGDFELLIEWKIAPTVDSGIYLKTMPQVQVWDPTQADPGNLGKAKGSGGLWNNSAGSPGKDPLVRADNPPGQWNKFRILMVGERTTVFLNDKLVVDHARMENFWKRTKGAANPLPVKAPIILQTHAPELEIRWRNIFVREIPADEANKILADKVGDGFATVFNGKDFDGWQGATANYEVVDGALRCKKGKGGVLFTKDEYADFQVALEIKLPKDGNNGLGIRYPGKGDGAYSGMCELQVLDDNYSHKIDPRQAHGSAYGMAAAARGYQRPIGEWNFQLVTVKGPTIQVELNGNLILDTDLSKVTQYMANSPHPGKDRTSGYFGFLGHNDPVEFRNVRIKKLN
ncbi:MAG: DUF1080 domain-containing protein [Gemmataceae bacterium]